MIYRYCTQGLTEDQLLQVNAQLGFDEAVAEYEQQRVDYVALAGGEIG